MGFVVKILINYKYIILINNRSQIDGYGILTSFGLKDLIQIPGVRLAIFLPHWDTHVVQMAPGSYTLSS